ncbi:MAG: hypothetical protein ABI707_10140 [Ferruginibacter sp.]
MSEHLPYEDELSKRLNDLPLPGADIAWEDMRRRLEKDDEDRPVIPPLLKGCGGYALLLLLLVTAFFVIVDPLDWFHNKIKKEPVKITVIYDKTRQNENKINGDKKLPVNNTNNQIGVIDDSALIKKNVAGSVLTADTSFKINGSLKRRSSPGIKYKTGRKHTGINNQHIKTYHFVKLQRHHINVKNKYQQKLVTKKTGGKLNSRVTGNAVSDTVTTGPLHESKIEEYQPAKGDDSIVHILPKARPKSDSDKKVKTDTTAFDAKVKADSPDTRRIYFSAGMGLHQLLPVAGQKSNPYNSLGRKSSFGDYIPSIYLRMYKEKKWFLQSEFRYGAPQYTKEKLFSQKKIIDPLNATATTTNSTIKKTYYHQLPLSFNYFVLPGLSIGAGFTFNKFKSALVQQEVHRTVIITQIDSVLSSGFINQKKADSNFVTIYIQALGETQYQWRRFSVGARYSFGLQPYLKFKLPGGEEHTERNSSLQLFIRYELWRSLKK